MTKVLISLISFTIIFISCRSQGNMTSENSSQNDTLQYYFSGNVNFDKGINIFSDCATQREFYVVDLSGDYAAGASKVADIARGDVYCSFRGFITMSDTINIISFRRFEVGYQCRGKPLTGYYQANGDTLRLKDDYTFNIYANNGESHNGKWMKTYKNEGILLSDDSRHKFIINYGVQNSQYNIILSFNDLNNKTKNFVPLAL